MMAPVDPKAATRLGKLCGLLGSDHEGERSNAAALATRELRALGMSWQELVARAFPRCIQAPAHAAAPASGDRWCREMLRRLLGVQHLLTGWEAAIVENIAAKGPAMTLRDVVKLCEIIERVRARGIVP